jgi:hypothetical protein
MKIEFNIWVVIWWAVFWISCITIFIIAVNNAQEYYAYQKYISDNQKAVVDFYYSCDSNFYSAMYNCASNLQLKNLTGYYCNGTMICQNSYKLK